MLFLNILPCRLDLHDDQHNDDHKSIGFGYSRRIWGKSFGLKLYLLCSIDFYKQRSGTGLNF